jgi:hypothetical protein
MKGRFIFHAFMLWWIFNIFARNINFTADETMHWRGEMGEIVGGREYYQGKWGGVGPL